MTTGLLRDSTTDNCVDQKWIFRSFDINFSWIICKMVGLAKLMKFYMFVTQTLHIARKDDKFFQLNSTQVI